MGNLCSPTRLRVGNNSHSAGAEASQPPANTFFFPREIFILTGSPQDRQTCKRVWPGTDSHTAEMAHEAAVTV